MPVLQSGKLNVNALSVADAYVLIKNPPPVIQGVASNILGIVGIGDWGPVNVPVTVGDPAGAAAIFGAMVNRKYDLATAVTYAAMQGANNFALVRVTDGTDVAASATLNGSDSATQLTIASKYTGSLGNQIAYDIEAGTNSTVANPTFKLIITMPGQNPEIYDNIGGTNNAIWQNMANAVNLGQSGVRGPSQMVVLTAGPSTVAPTVGSKANLAGGTSGNLSVDKAKLLGADVSPRTGLYALRNSGASVAYLADNADSSTWANELAYGQSEGTYMVFTGPAGDTLSNAVSTKQTAGIDNWLAKILYGDWVYVYDSINAVTRMISPQHFYAGLRVALSPEQSTLNKPMAGIVGTQASQSNKKYSSAELQQLAAAGIDIITNPVPGGNYFGMRLGVNSASDASVNQDQYATLTNFIAYTLQRGTGIFVGELQTPDEQRTAKATLEHFLQQLKDAQQIDDYKVTLGQGNNPLTMQALGYQQALVLVRYFNTIKYFVVNFQGGGTVTW